MRARSAAQLLGAGTWTIDGASLRIEVPGMGKKMLALTVNAAAEKIIRQELQRLGAPTRFSGGSRRGHGAGGAALQARAAGRQHSGGRARNPTGAAGKGDFQG
jgi:hypothetical protein